MKLYVLGNAQREGVASTAERLLPWLRSCAEVLVVDLLQQSDLSAQPAADVALVLGGDGAILRAARQMGYRQIPVLGVNLGHLGFLADLDPEQLRTCLPLVLAGEYRLTRHLMYECLIEQLDAGGAVREQQRYLGLNEIVVHTMPPFSILDIDLRINQQPMARFSGDGLIISTPVGSTAHSLSAGGPILGQELQAFVITPICPHALTYRPVVESAEHTYTIALGGRSTQAVVSIDGQQNIPLGVQQRVTLRKAPVVFSLVKVAGRGFYTTLREKLHWGALPNYRREP